MAEKMEASHVADFTIALFKSKMKSEEARRQVITNFLYSIDSNKASYQAAKLFSQFASGEIDPQTLQFFLFSRYLFEKETRTRIFEKGKGNAKNPAQFLLTRLEAKEIIFAAFSSDDPEFLKNLLSKYSERHKVASIEWLDDIFELKCCLHFEIFTGT